MTLSPHPRLYITQQHIDRLTQNRKNKHLDECQAIVERETKAYLHTEIDYGNGHNYLLIRARMVQSRIICFLIRYQQTGKSAYRQAVLQLIREMKNWKYWSWISMRSKFKADELFDLSYGENCATLAIAYDWLYNELSNAEKKLFISTAAKWGFHSGLKNCNPEASWWFGKPDSNWNSVCAGGLGMLALAMAEDVPDAEALIPDINTCITPFMHHLKDTKGAWPEGIGYWNYGFRYAFMYLLSWENTYRKTHELMKHKSVKDTLHFNLDLCPQGNPCSFGDVNYWTPMGFHYLVAERLKQTDVLAKLDIQPKADHRKEGWPVEAEWLLFHPGTQTPVSKRQSPFVKIYKGMDWCVLADRMPEPNMYMSIRGGDTKVPHGQRDLMSFHCVVKGERLITQSPAKEYLDTTFSSRREELFEINPGSKNTLFINGVGINADSHLDSTQLINKHKDLQAVRLIATSAMNSDQDRKVANFCGRIIIMINNAAYLIIDHADLHYLGRLESRIHSLDTTQVQKNSAVIQGKKQALRLTYAADVDAVLAQASAAPTNPLEISATQLRWCSEKIHSSVCLATLITPGKGQASVQLQTSDKEIVAVVETKKWKKRIVLDKRLRLQ